MKYDISTVDKSFTNPSPYLGIFWDSHNNYSWKRGFLTTLFFISFPIKDVHIFSESEKQRAKWKRIGIPALAFY